MIDENPITNPIEKGSLAWIMLMGINHEMIHLETSAVIISQVFSQLKFIFLNLLTYYIGSF
jgi:hypothetical protein